MFGDYVGRYGNWDGLVFSVCRFEMFFGVEDVIFNIGVSV